MNYQVKMYNSLKEAGHIEFEDLIEIADAFQIASGQSYAIGNTKGIMDYIIENGSIVIRNYSSLENDKQVNSILKLNEIFKQIDKYIDFKNDKDFSQYFK